MKFDWETEDEKLRRQIRMPAKKKLEWLWQMNSFSYKFSTPRVRKIRQKLRQGF